MSHLFEENWIMQSTSMYLLPHKSDRKANLNLYSIPLLLHSTITLTLPTLPSKEFWPFPDLSALSKLLTSVFNNCHMVKLRPTPKVCPLPLLGMITCILKSIHIVCCTVVIQFKIILTCLQTLDVYCTCHAD